MTIDLDKVIHDKMGTRAKWVPRFVVSWLKRTIHQDWINGFITREEQLGHVGVSWVEDCMEYIGVTVEVRGMENLPSPDAAPCTFVSNHPLGGADGVALCAILGKRYDGRLKCIVNDLLMNLEGMSPFFIPVNKTGSQSRMLPAMVEAGFSSENHMLLFPAGLCSRLIDGKVQDLPWQKTFVQKSVKTHRQVIPIHFSGHNSPRFYKIARWCKRLGLKFNLAMLFLPDELYKGQGKHCVVTIGKPIPYETFDDSRKPAEWAQYVREIVYNLQDK